MPALSTEGEDETKRSAIGPLSIVPAESKNLAGMGIPGRGRRDIRKFLNAVLPTGD